MGDKVGVLNHGRIIQVGTPGEIYGAPHDTFVAAFVGTPAMNLIKGELSGGRIAVPGAFALPLDDAGRRRLMLNDGPLIVGIRAEDVRLGGEGVAAARVHHVENHGVEKIVTLRAGDCLFKATVPAMSPVAVEDSVRFAWNQDKVQGFDAETGLNRTRHDMAAGG